MAPSLSNTVPYRFSTERFYQVFYYKYTQRTVYFVTAREPDPGDMYTFLKIASLWEDGLFDREPEHRPGDPRVAKRHSYLFCDFSGVNCVL